MKPILQREQRLQKYANTHPLRMRTAGPCQSQKIDRLFLALSQVYLAPGPEKLL